MLDVERRCLHTHIKSNLDGLLPSLCCCWSELNCELHGIVEACPMITIIVIEMPLSRCLALHAARLQHSGCQWPLPSIEQQTTSASYFKRWALAITLAPSCMLMQILSCMLPGLSLDAEAIPRCLRRGRPSTLRNGSRSSTCPFEACLQLPTAEQHEENLLMCIPPTEGEGANWPMIAPATMHRSKKPMKKKKNSKLKPFPDMSSSSSV